MFLLVKTGRWNGVVTAFITMSGIKDEIDWEFPGADTTTGQTNFFWQGNIREFSSNGVCRRLYIRTANKTQGEVENGIPDTYSNYHAFAVRRSGSQYSEDALII